MFKLEIDDLAEKPYIPQKKITAMNLLQMSCVITYAYLFLTSMEAVRGHTPYRDHTLWHCGMDRTLN